MTTRNCNAALTAAFVSSGDSDELARRFSIEISSATSLPAAGHDLDVLTQFGVCMRYKAADTHSPLDLVFTSQVMGDYTGLWRMLMQVQRMAHAARTLWSLMKGLAQPHKRLGFVAVYSTRLNLIRHEMQHFVNKLQDYFMAHVLYIQWAKFEALLVEAKELSEIRQLHDDYLKTLRSSCLLERGSAGLWQVIASMFELVLTFADQLASLERNSRQVFMRDMVAPDIADELTQTAEALLRTGELFRANAALLKRLLAKVNSLNPTGHDKFVLEL